MSDRLSSDSLTLKNLLSQPTSPTKTDSKSEKKNCYKKTENKSKFPQLSNRKTTSSLPDMNLIRLTSETKFYEQSHHLLTRHVTSHILVTAATRPRTNQPTEIYKNLLLLQKTDKSYNKNCSCCSQVCDAMRCIQAGRDQCASE